MLVMGTELDDRVFSFILPRQPPGGGTPSEPGPPAEPSRLVEDLWCGIPVTVRDPQSYSRNTFSFNCVLVYVFSTFFF